MSKPSVGVFYNADIRNNGTARRVTEAMRRMGMQQWGFVRYTRPTTSPIMNHDFHLFIDDGRDDISWLPPRPNACWLIDTHLGYDRRLGWAKQFDHVFLAQKEDVDRMRAEKVENVHWLPLACSPYLDPSYDELMVDRGRKVDLTRSYDCVFVGFMNRGTTQHPASKNRIEFLDRIMKEFPNSWLAYNLFFDKAAELYVKARVGLNVSICNDLNMRFFEILSYGVCQVCNVDMVGLDDLGFVEGEHYLGWASEDEAIWKIRWALEHPEQRERIATQGLDAVRHGHTYEDRVKTIIRTVGK